MRYKFNLCGRRPNSQSPKPHSWSDLNDLGLAPDHFYHSFIELGKDRCPNCGNLSFEAHWIKMGKRQGWRYGCPECGQEWREPQIIPKPHEPVDLKPDVREVPRPEIMVVEQKDFIESEYPDGFIRRYK